MAATLECCQPSTSAWFFCKQVNNCASTAAAGATAAMQVDHNNFTKETIVNEEAVSENNSLEYKCVKVRSTSSSVLISKTMRPYKPPPPHSGGRQMPASCDSVSTKSVAGMQLRAVLGARGFSSKCSIRFVNTWKTFLSDRPPPDISVPRGRDLYLGFLKANLRAAV
ncbi:hypothetical protein EVAR_19087_1 [Eumeta japonica]|uniref:Uncharacterized protein n=1 Tax=Eumeta variegata TaxID=151549 RepID=A0A4C1UPH9_EUMVA|nr:hypothetical protein EVAR_19087_1 [Eumeta japonica]